MAKASWEKKIPRESPKILVKKNPSDPDRIRKTLVINPDANTSKYSLERKSTLIDRGKKENLRSALTTRDVSLLPFASRQYDKRIGIVTKVLDGDRIIVSDDSGGAGYLVVKIKYVETPNYKTDPEGWRKAKQFLESLLLNQTVVLKISANERNFAGDTLAEVYLAGTRSYPKKQLPINLTLPYLPRKGKSALLGGDVPLYEYNIKLDESIRYENSVSQKIVEAGFSLSADQFKAKSIADQKKRMARQIERVVQKAKEQAALPADMRERPPPSWSDMDFWDKVNSIQYMTQAEAINFIVFLKTGQWGNVKLTDKIAAGKIFRRLLEERDKKRDPKDPLNELGIYRGRNAVVELIGNIAGDPLIVVGWGRGIFTKVLQVRGKTIPLTYAGERAWIQLIAKYGEFEAKWHMLRLIKENPSYIQKEGLRILGTNLEAWYLLKKGGGFVKGLLPAPARAGVEYIGRGINIELNTLKRISSTSKGALSTQSRHAIEKIQKLEVMERAVALYSKVLVKLSPAKELPAIKAVTPEEIKESLNSLKFILRKNAELAQLEVDLIQEQSIKEVGRGKGKYLNELYEAGLDTTPKEQMILRQIEQINKEIVEQEAARGINYVARDKYIRHVMAPEFKKLYGIEDPLYGILHPETDFAIKRKYGGTAKEINEKFVKNVGVPIFEEDIFKAQKIRSIESVKAITIIDYLKGIKEQYGVSLKYKNELRETHIESEIPELKGVLMPKEVVAVLEKDPDMLARIKAYKQIRPTAAESVFKSYQSIRYGFQRIVTAYYAAFYARNVASGTYENIRHGMINPKRIEETERVLAITDDPVHSAIRSIKKGYGETGSDFAFKSEKGEEFTAERIRDIARKGKILNQPGMIDINRNIKPWETSSKAEFLSALPRAMLKSTENRLRMSLLIDRLHRGDSEEAAIAFVNSVHFDYFRDLSRAEIIASQFMPFTTFRTQNMLLQTSFLAKHPGIATLPPKVAMTWNSEEDEVMLSYKPDYLSGAILLKVPGTQDAFARVPLQSEDLTMLPNYFSTTTLGFYWDEAKTNPNIILKFAKYNLGIEWLRNGGGVPVYNEVTGEIKITYKKTGESITAKMNPEGTELVFYDDVKNEPIKSFKVESKGGKQQVLKDNDPAKKLAKQYLYPWFVTPFELAEQKDYRTGAPIPLDNVEDYVSYFMLTYGGSRFKYNIEVAGDPLTENWEAFFELGLGWNIYHAKDWMILPDEAREVIKKHEIRKLYGNYRGCGF